MRDWRVRRVWQPHPDGQRHWDRTYQQLMAWTHTAGQDAPRSRPTPHLPHRGEP